MLDTNALIEKLQEFGVGRRRLEDELFSCDRVPARLGIHDEDEEDLCHQLVPSVCEVPGCAFVAADLPARERHYAAAHRYSCGACRRALPSPHLLDLHLQETHDSYFAAMAARKPSYFCYIQECTDKFVNAEERLEHCIKVHKLPKDFRFEIKPKAVSKPKKTKLQASLSMDVDVAAAASCPEPGTHKFFFHNSKQKGLIKYSGKTFTSNKSKTSTRTTDVDQIMSDLKQNLPK